jgi:hypothetical protein
MARKLEFLSPYSPAECVRQLQDLAAKGPFYIGKGKGLFRSTYELLLTRIKIYDANDRVRFRMSGYAFSSPSPKTAGMDIRATGSLERQGAYTRVRVAIGPGPVARVAGAAVLFILVALALIATLLRAYNLEELIRILIGLFFLSVVVYALYGRTYASCSAQLALLVHKALTARNGIPEVQGSSRPTWLAALESGHDGKGHQAKRKD